jgi:hypothetical protein
MENYKVFVKIITAQENKLPDEIKNMINDKI